MRTLLRALGCALLLVCGAAPAMAQRITALPAASTPTGTDLVACVQSSGTITAKCTLAQIIAALGAPPTSGVSLLMGNGAGGFTNVTLGTNLSFSGSTLNATGGGGGVSSVGLSVPAFLSVSGSPVTTSGTLAISYSGTALPVLNGGTGITSFGTGVAAALALNVSGTGAFCLASGSACTGAGSNITIGTTTVTSGTSGRLLYDNAGVAGELTGATTSGGTLTLIAPILGTPASGTLTNTTGFPAANLAGLGTGVATALAGNVSGSGVICLSVGSLCAGGSGGLTVGTTTISSGVSGKVETNNSGVLGETAISGTGSLCAASGSTCVGMVDITKTADYTVTAADMGNGINLSGTAHTLTMPAASGTIFAPGMTLAIANTTTSNWTLATASLGLTITGLNVAPSGSNYTIYPGTSGTFVANSNGTGLDFFAAMQSPTTTSLGGVLSSSAGSHQFASGIGLTGTVTYAQPAITDISGFGTGVATALAANVSGTGAICLASGSACSGGGSNITIGTTTVTSGTTTRILYDNGGVVGEYSLSGTGSVCMSSGSSCSGGASTIIAPQGRLTLTSGTPVLTGDVSSAGTLYYDCYVGNQLPYYTGSADALDTVSSCEVSTAMQTSSTGVLNSTGVFDVAWDATNHNICVITNGSGGGWASDTGGTNAARGTGYSQIHNTRGYWTFQNTTSHCYNAATDYGSATADKRSYLGTIYTNAAGKVSMLFKPSPASGGTANILGLWNAYNRVSVTAFNRDSSTAWTTASVVFEPLNAGGTGSGLLNRVTFVEGIAQEQINGSVQIQMQATTATQLAYGAIGMSLDSTTAAPEQPGIFYTGSPFTQGGEATVPTGQGLWAPQVGLHYIQAEDSATTGATNMSFGPNESLKITLAM